MEYSIKWTLLISNWACCQHNLPIPTVQHIFHPRLFLSITSLQAFSSIISPPHLLLPLWSPERKRHHSSTGGPAGRLDPVPQERGRAWKRSQAAEQVIKEPQTALPAAALEMAIRKVSHACHCFKLSIPPPLISPETSENTVRTNVPGRDHVIMPCCVLDDNWTITLCGLAGFRSAFQKSKNAFSPFITDR